MNEYVTICKIGSIPEGTGRSFQIDGAIVAVFNDAGEYRAINDFCPHMGASLAEGHFENGFVTCPWHAWRFCVHDGAWCDNPMIKTDWYPVRILDDEIQVSLTGRSNPDDKPDDT